MNLILTGFVGTGPLVLFGLLVCSVSGAADPGQTSTNTVRAARVIPPRVPVSTSQFDYFRQLVKSKGAEREALLAKKSPPHQQTLRSYLREYDRLTPEECENRICAMELRTVLVSLLRLAPSNRTESVKLISDRVRPLVEARLKIWETFSAEEQNDVLTNELVLRIFIGSAAGVRRDGSALSLSASNQLSAIEPRAQWWRNLPEDRRVRIQQNFARMFEVTDAEKAKETLQPLSPEDRVTMERSLERYRKLPPIQRAQCLQGFGKFAELSPAERRQFLANAEEWKKMTPADREAWQKLVTRMPPVPPGLGLPPVPRVRQPRTSTTVLATNGN